MTEPNFEDDLQPSDLSLVLIHLLKGPLYRDTHEKLWGMLLAVRNQVGDHVSVLGLNLVIDEAEGYAYLRSQPDDPGWWPDDNCPSTSACCSPSCVSA